MLKFAANLSTMYTDLPFLDRFEAAAKDGFKGVEFLFPYAFPSHELAARLRVNGLQHVLFNAPPGGTNATLIQQAWDTGGRGLACVPNRDAEFKTGFNLALEYANALNCHQIHVMAGLIPPGFTRESVEPTYINNLRWACIQAAMHQITVLIEPINQRNMPGFFLNRQDHAHAILEQVNAPNLKVQMDLYHCQIVEGDVTMKIRQYLPTGQIGHFQIASIPDRHEPNTGELNYAYVLDELRKEIKKAKWTGWIGCEYTPQLGHQAGGTSAGLGWLKQALALV